MFLYGVIYAVIENNLRRILCFASISQKGIMLMAISIGTRDLLAAAAILAFCHILYKCLMTICTGIITDTTEVEFATDIKKLPYSLWPVGIGIVVGLCFIIAVPFVGSFIPKSVTLNEFMEYGTIYLLFLAGSSILLLCYPWRKIFLIDEYMVIKHKQSNHSVFALYFMIIISVFISIFIKPISKFALDIEFFISDIALVDQFLLITASLMVT